MLKATKAVLWGFLGVRNEEGRREDFKINILHIIVVGILTTCLFISLLIGVVKYVVL